MFDILIPSYGRPDRLYDVVDNILKNSIAEHNILFGVEYEQVGIYVSELSKIEYEYIDVISSPKEGIGSYARSINILYQDCIHKNTENTHFFCASDDLNFHPGWDQTLLDAVAANPDKLVFGTNDLFNKEVRRGTHATHYLVDYNYISDFGGTLDNSYPVLYEYRHNYCDTEFIDTAKKRGLFLPVLESVVEHNHHYAHKSDLDETYRKNMQTVREDRRTYDRRSHLWVS